MEDTEQAPIGKRTGLQKVEKAFLSDVFKPCWTAPMLLCRGEAVAQLKGVALASEDL